MANQNLNPNAMDLSDDHVWRDRSERWSRRALRNTAPRSKRERPRLPLILTGHGVSLRIEGGSLTIRNGFTHYPEKQETYRYFKGELALPERIIMLDGSGSISFDVLSWLSEQGVSLVRIDWGEVVCVASRSGYAANPYRVQWQREMRADEFRRMEFSVSKITAKIENSISTTAHRGMEQGGGNCLFHVDEIRRKAAKSNFGITGFGS